MLVGALAVAVGMLVFHESRKSGASLSPQQAVTLVNAEGGIFVDLREHSDYGKGHIAGAINIPFSKIDGRMAELDKYRDKPVILVDKMGQHAGSVGKKLGENGFSGVYRMSGGMMEWGHLQLPLVK